MLRGKYLTLQYGVGSQAQFSGIAAMLGRVVSFDLPEKASQISLQYKGLRSPRKTSIDETRKAIQY